MQLPTQDEGQLVTCVVVDSAAAAKSIHSPTHAEIPKAGNNVPRKRAIGVPGRGPDQSILFPTGTAPELTSINPTIYHDESQELNLKFNGIDLRNNSTLFLMKKQYCN